VRLTSNNAHVLAIDGGGLPYAWGYNAYGQIANGTKINGRYAMPMLAGPSQPFGAVIDVATSGSHSLLLRASDKSVWAVGRNFHGQLGYQELNQLNQPITPDKVYPVQVQGL
jgi:alpha-tubulin suppressor-like RCC1 family protein